MEKGRPAKIIEKLADAGVFDSGGMLIGSYAFSCYGNMLGVVFDDVMLRTEDMDVAYDRSIEIGFVRDVRSDISEAAP
ncbi:MAG: GSU2403 family nucleotidyltransferase fold protein [Methylotenera sp.]